eukprot:COSAG01_NODE_60448_length_294_cov_3.594872_1_plen_84_part_10
MSFTPLPSRSCVDSLQRLRGYTYTCRLRDGSCLFDGQKLYRLAQIEPRHELQKRRNFTKSPKSAKQEFGSCWDRHTIRAERPAE